MARTYAAIAGKYTTQKFVFETVRGAAGYIYSGEETVQRALMIAHLA